MTQTGDASKAAARVEALLERIRDALGLEAEIAVDDDGTTLRGVLIGEDLGLFIGRHGQTIDAIQHLAYRVAARSASPAERRLVEVDAAGYRLRRSAALERAADEAADDALRSGDAVRLDAMSAPERKHVHEYLRRRGDVETHSEGEEPRRHLVIQPAEA